MTKIIKPESRIIQPNKVIWDSVEYNCSDAHQGLINPITNSIDSDLDDSYFEGGINVIYTLIANYQQSVRDAVWSAAQDSIRGRAAYGRIAEARKIISGDYCDLGRIATPCKINLANEKLQQEIYRGRWEKDRYLHTKKADALLNLVQKIDQEFMR
jgi:hypothetical protein